MQVLGHEKYIPPAFSSLTRTEERNRGFVCNCCLHNWDAGLFIFNSFAHSYMNLFHIHFIAYFSQPKWNSQMTRSAPSEASVGQWPTVTWCVPSVDKGLGSNHAAFFLFLFFPFFFFSFLCSICNWLCLSCCIDNYGDLFLFDSFSRSSHGFISYTHYLIFVFW